MGRNGLDVDRALSESEDAPTHESMRGGVRTPRNPRTDQTKVRRRIQRSAGDGPTLKTCPNCHRSVEVLRIEHEGGHQFMTCPNCGHRSPLAKEGSRMSHNSTVAQLLREAAKADTAADAARLVGEAERLRSEAQLTREASRQLDLAGTEVRDRLTPSPVHELHTASTDWIAETEVGTGENLRQAMITGATEWYGNLHEAVRADSGEFRIQAEGMADRESGAFAEDAGTARQTFLTMAATLRQRDISRGVIKEAEIVGDNTNVGMGAADVLGQNPPTGGNYEGLPGDQTSSMRVPNIADMSQNGTSPNDPGEGTGNGIADAGNGDGWQFGAGEQRTPSTSTASRRTANGPLSGGPMNWGTSGPGGGLEWEPSGDGHMHFGLDPQTGDTHATVYPLESGGAYLNHYPRGDMDRNSDRDVQSTHHDSVEDAKAAADYHHDQSRSQRQGSKKKWDKGSDDRPPWETDEPDDDEKKTDNKKEGAMEHIAVCPSCQGFGAVATSEPGRQKIAQLKRQGISGLDQLDQLIAPDDIERKETPYPTQVAFPMEEGGWNPANGVQEEIAQAEQQVAEREQRKGASRQAKAEWAAREAYRQVMAATAPANPWSFLAGQDDSGWMGDMGAGGVGPGEQDGGNPGGGNNLNYVDPVYGQGGDQPPGPRQPYGQDEANDRTNVPDSWQPGQPTQMDQGARNNELASAPAPGFPDESTYGDNSGGNQYLKSSSKTAAIDSDPEIVRAQRFIRSRIAQLQGS